MSDKTARFHVGELIYHNRFDYRGVVVDVDACFSGTEEWYNNVARSNPPRDEPWYHVLVDQAAHLTYVAEKNMESDLTGQPIVHPLLNQFFNGIQDGVYISVTRSH